MYQALAGFYTPGLKYEAAKALAAKLPPETRAAVLAQAVQALPSCYDQPFSDCLNDKPNTFAGCKPVLEGYAVNWDAMEQAVKQIKYCPAPNKLLLLGGGAALLALGIGLGVILSK